MSGARSSRAHATPFTTDATPGPSVVRQAPGRPVISACASAAIAAPVSVAVSTNGSAAREQAATRSRLLPPPGMPNTHRTPACRRRATTRSATDGIGRESIISVVPAIDLHQDLRNAVRDLCRSFPDSYWRELDAARAYPDAFVRALTDAGYLAALIPEEYGGAGLGVAEASIILEEINRSGGTGGASHSQMYTMGTLLRHGSERQKRAFLPKIATGELRLQAFGVTEPTTGSDTTQLKTMATRRGDNYIVRGQKVFISRAEHSDLLLLVVRTTPLEQVAKRTDGLSILLVDLRETVGRGITIRPIRTMMNHATTEL